MAARFKNRGFTLIELMVVVGIILIITGAAIPSLTSYMRNQAVRQAQQQIISDMRSTQVKALAGTLSDLKVDGSLIRYWGINFTEDSGVYTIFVNSVEACGGNIRSTEYLPEGSSDTLALKTVGGNVLPKCILFEMLDGDISDPNLSFETRTIVVRFSSDTGSDKGVTFNRMGLIFAQD